MNKLISIAVLASLIAGCTEDPEPKANARPTAKIAAVSVAQTEKPLTLDGSGSADADGDKLSFTWALKTKPADSKSALSGEGAKPTFTPDKEGEYVVTLVTSDGKEESDEVSAKITASKCPDGKTICVNNKPTAVAGQSYVALTTEKITLDASASSDPEEDKLTFAWTLEKKPDTSTAKLDDAAAVKPSFTPDVAGSYVLALVADDGKDKSDKATIEIVAQAGTLKPIARIGAPKDPKIAVDVEIDGSISLAPKGKTLTYAWTLKTRPTDSTATIPEGGAKPKFKADKEGKYTFELKVSDGTAESELGSLEVEFKK